VVAKKAPLQPLTVFLCKTGVETDGLIDAEKKPVVSDVDLGSGVAGKLYSKPSNRVHPKWVEFFGKAIDPKKLELWSSSAAAVLVVPVRKRLVAVTFGYGRFLLEPSAIDRTFGLRATLNSVDPTKLRSIDTKTFEGITTHTREQSSKETSLSGFGLDVERDLVRAVVGTPEDETLGRRMAGMDALSVSVRVSLDALPKLLARYVAKANSRRYKKEYPWIDNIGEVRDRSLVQNLDELVFSAIRTGDYSRKWLAVPDIVDWERLAGFRYSRAKTARLHSDVHLATYCEQVRDVSKLDASLAKRHKVRAIATNSESEVRRWSVYESLYAEVDEGGASYLLTGGGWYEIDPSFQNRINRAVDAIPTSGLKFIPCGEKEEESTYNRRLKKAWPGSALMDQKNVMYGGGRSRIEFCDVLTPKKELVHVKRYSGSSVMSHLFAQGTVAATAFVSDTEFRRELNKKLPKEKRLRDPSRRPTASHYKVCFAVASSSSTPLTLPFFSRVTLRNAVKILESYGYKVSLDKIDVQ